MSNFALFLLLYGVGCVILLSFYWWLVRGTQTVGGVLLGAAAATIAGIPLGALLAYVFMQVIL